MDLERVGHRGSGGLFGPIVVAEGLVGKMVEESVVERGLRSEEG